MDFSERQPMKHSFFKFLTVVGRTTVSNFVQLANVLGLMSSDWYDSRLASVMTVYSNADDPIAVAFDRSRPFSA